MESDNSCRLSDLSFPLKLLSTCFILSVWLGYAVAILKIHELSDFSLHEVLLYYRGDETGLDAMRIGQSFGGMLSVSHVHTFSQPMLFALLGIIFALSDARSFLKSFIVVLAFASLAISNASPWLIKYVSGHMVFLLPFSQAAIFLCLIIMSYCSLRDAWKK